MGKSFDRDSIRVEFPFWGASPLDLMSQTSGCFLFLDICALFGLLVITDERWLLLCVKFLVIIFDSPYWRYPLSVLCIWLMLSLLVTFPLHLTSWLLNPVLLCFCLDNRLDWIVLFTLLRINEIRLIDWFLKMMTNLLLYLVCLLFSSLLLQYLVYCYQSLS